LTTTHYRKTADTVRVTGHQEESAIQIFTGDSKSEQGVRAGFALFIHNKLMKQKTGFALFIHNKLMKQETFTLHNNCSNNQAEQWAIVKALETIPEIQAKEDIPRDVTIHTDSRITLQSLQNSKNHKFLIEEIGKKKQNFLNSTTGKLLLPGFRPM
jgi:ribonuclease HI